MSTHSICLYGEIRNKYPRIITRYSSLTTPLLLLLLLLFIVISRPANLVWRYNVFIYLSVRLSVRPSLRDLFCFLLYLAGVPSKFRLLALFFVVYMSLLLSLLLLFNSALRKSIITIFYFHGIPFNYIFSIQETH